MNNIFLVKNAEGDEIVAAYDNYEDALSAADWIHGTVTPSPLLDSSPALGYEFSAWAEFKWDRSAAKLVSLVNNFSKPIKILYDDYSEVFVDRIKTSKSEDSWCVQIDFASTSLDSDVKAKLASAVNILSANLARRNGLVGLDDANVESFAQDVEDEISRIL